MDRQANGRLTPGTRVDARHRRDTGTEDANRKTHNGSTVLSLPAYCRRVKRGPLNGEAVWVMAGMVLDDLLRFTPQTRSEAAVAGRALRHAETLYQDARWLAREVGILNALIAERGEAGSA